MVNPEHEAVVRKGAASIKEWRRKHPGQILNLMEANLSEIDLSGANLMLAILVDANLFEANLSGAKFKLANLSRANLSEANLSKADLSWTTLAFVKLLETNLSNTDLQVTTLAHVDASKVNITGAKVGYTKLAGCNLAHCVGLETVKHKGPSNIDIETLIKSFKASGNCLTPELKTFFLNSGIPKELLDELPRILAEVQYYTSFVCYGHPDLGFAQKLVEDLKAKGVCARNFEGDEFHVMTAKTLEEARELAKAGFDYFTEIEGVQVFRKRK